MPFLALIMIHIGLSRYITPDNIALNTEFVDANQINLQHVICMQLWP